MLSVSQLKERWGYEDTPFTLEKFQGVIDLLSEVRADTRFEAAWESAVQKAR